MPQDLDAALVAGADHVALADHQAPADHVAAVGRVAVTDGAGRVAA